MNIKHLFLSLQKASGALEAEIVNHLANKGVYGIETMYRMMLLCFTTHCAESAASLS